MLQVRRELDLLEEALGTHDRGELRVQDLECDLAVVPNVFRQIHGGHAAAPELALYAIAIGQDGGGTLDRHRRDRSSARSESVDAMSVVAGEASSLGVAPTYREPFSEAEPVAVNRRRA